MMRNMKRNLASNVVAAVAALAIGALASTGARAVVVDIELQLLVDVSGSIDTNEFNLQRNGYVAAFQNGAVQTQIANNPNGIAVQLVYWSGVSQQQVAVGWTHLTDATSANAFAAAIGAAGRPFSGLTAIQTALNFGANQFGANGFEGTKKIIDISGDGSRNDGLSGTLGRDAALSVVDTINGLVIGGDPSVLSYYVNNVIGGTGAFATTAGTFNNFASAIANKIFHETGGTGDIPEPATLLLFGIGLAGLGYARRRRAA